MSDIQRDREERQHVIEVLKQMRLDYEDFWEENDTEEIKAFNYAIASIETDLKYDLLYEQESNCSEIPTGSTTKNDLPHCQYTDAEVAKSFIEDVEAVKDQLPCGEQMDFPNTFDEFANEYGFKDKDEVYTNGSELIQVFRVKQWLEHISTTKDYLGVDAISRQAINGYIDYILSHGMGKRKSFEFIKKFVANLTPVTPQEPKIGHWIDDMSIGYHVSICSNCNWRGHGDTCLIYKPKYCPNCGARMVEPQESEG